MPGLSCLGAAHGSCSNQHVARGPCGRACNFGTVLTYNLSPSCRHEASRPLPLGRVSERITSSQLSQMISNFVFCAKTEVREG